MIKFLYIVQGDLSKSCDHEFWSYETGHSQWLTAHPRPGCTILATCEVASECRDFAGRPGRRFSGDMVGFVGQRRDSWRCVMVECQADKAIAGAMLHPDAAIPVRVIGGECEWRVTRSAFVGYRPTAEVVADIDKRRNHVERIVSNSGVDNTCHRIVEVWDNSALVEMITVDKHGSVIEDEWTRTSDLYIAEWGHCEEGELGHADADTGWSSFVQLDAHNRMVDAMNDAA